MKIDNCLRYCFYIKYKIWTIPSFVRTILKILQVPEDEAVLGFIPGVSSLKHRVPRCKEQPVQMSCGVSFTPRGRVPSNVRVRTVHPMSSDFIFWFCLFFLNFLLFLHSFKMKCKNNFTVKYFILWDFVIPPSHCPLASLGSHWSLPFFLNKGSLLKAVSFSWEFPILPSHL